MSETPCTNHEPLEEFKTKMAYIWKLKNGQTETSIQSPAQLLIEKDSIRKWGITALARSDTEEERVQIKQYADSLHTELMWVEERGRLLSLPTLSHTPQHFSAVSATPKTWGSLSAEEHRLRVETRHHTTKGFPSAI
jgi:hypothetical protein